jgi:hypothetical protein
MPFDIMLCHAGKGKTTAVNEAKPQTDADVSSPVTGTEVPLTKVRIPWEGALGFQRPRVQFLLGHVAVPALSCLF